MSSKKIHAQPPKKLTGIELEKIPSSATGFTAIKSAITHIKDEVGLKKGIGLLANLNQKNGFDCPGMCLARSRREKSFPSRIL
jgi:hypothetical protein